MTPDEDKLMLEQRAKSARRVTALGMAINAVLLVLKLAAGVLGKSQAMIADAVHTISDFVTDAVVLFAMRFSSKPRDEDHAYGHGKYETLAAMMVGFVLLFVAAEMGLDALHSIVRTIRGTAPARPGMIAFWAAAISVASKEFIFQRTIAVARRTGNDALVANAWHHRSDAMSSVAAAIGICVASFIGGKWAVMDSVAALAVSLMLLKVAWDIMKKQMGSLTEKSLDEAEKAEIIAMAESLAGVANPHNLRTRYVGSTVVVDIHVRMDPEMHVKEAHDIVSQLEQKLRDRFGPDTIANVHIEPRMRVR